MAAMIKKVGVIGAGQMGNGIAHVAALAGFDVVLNDVSADRAQVGAWPPSTAIWRARSPRSTITEDAARQALGRITLAETHRRPRRLRSRDRDRGREGRGQAQDLSRSLRGAEAGGDRRLQHLLDLDHAACRRHRPARALHRHSLHESGAADGAGRADPRHRHRRRDLRGVQGIRQPSSASRSRSPRISRPSSSTASCCR